MKKKVREDNSDTKSSPARIMDKTGISPAQEKFMEVKQMLVEGLAIKEIARRLKMSRNTIKKYRNCQEFSRKSYSSSTEIEKHLDYVKKRKKDCPEIQLKELHGELKKRGYCGAYSTLSDGLARYSLQLAIKRNKAYSS